MKRNIRHVGSLASLAAAVALWAATAPGHAQAFPDFSGIWAHLTWPDFEPPASGPGPVTNRSRRGSGGNSNQLVGDYTNPILKPAASEVVRQHGEMALSGTQYPTPSNQCWPGGVPFVLWNIGMQMLQRPDRITILYSNDHEVRQVRMNATHPAQLTPSWYGNSVGRYEGDTLVIDTVGVRIGPFAMLDMYGTPHTAALHVVERYRLLDEQAARAEEERGQRSITRIPMSDPGFARNPGYRGPGLQLDFTVDDDGVFTMPWSAGISYRRPLGGWPEVSCAEDAHVYLPGRQLALPTADKPDF